MTLNQIIKRIRQISLAHKQIRNFAYGLKTDFLADKTTRYPSAFLEDTSGTLDVQGKTLSVGFQIYLLDLVHVSENAKQNELDVQSDMMQIAQDLLSEFNLIDYNDWQIEGGTITIVYEQENDLIAGVLLAFVIKTPYELDACIVPTNELPVVIPQDDMKLVYDIKYVATGTEGVTLTPAMIPEITGKKLLLVTREFSPIYKVSSAPQSSEYTWDNTNVVLGVDTQPGERFLFLYRNY